MGKSITYQQIIDNLNVLDYDFYFRLVDAFLAEDTTQTLLIFDEILKRGFDAHHFISGLSSHLRDLLVCKDAATIQLMDVGAKVKEKYGSQAQKSSIDFLMDALHITNDCDLQYRIAKNKRLHVEFALLKAARVLDEQRKK